MRIPFSIDIAQDFKQVPYSEVVTFDLGCHEKYKIPGKWRMAHSEHGYCQ